MKVKLSTAAVSELVDEIARLKQQLEAERAKVADAIQAFTGMRSIYENQQMSTSSVAKEMLRVSISSLAALQAPEVKP
jgi:DNA-directed RNA polymerase subunit F